MTLRIGLWFLLYGLSLLGSTHAGVHITRLKAGVYSSIHKSFHYDRNDRSQVQDWKTLMIPQGTSDVIAPRACPFLPAPTPTPTPAELDFVELGVLFYEFGCSSNLTNNDLLFTLYGTVCPQLVARPDVPFQTIYNLTDNECFGFSLLNPKYNIGEAKVGFFFIMFQFGFFFFITVPRRHLQPLKSRDLVMTFIRFSSSLCNSIIPFGVIVYGLAFPVAIFAFAQYFSAPLTTGSFTHLAVHFIYMWMLVNTPMMNPFTGGFNERKLFFIKWKWVVSRYAFPLWMTFYYIIPMAELGRNYQLFPQNFQNNPSVFGTARVLWWDIGAKEVTIFLESKGVNITQVFAPSVYNPNGYSPYSPHFASVVVYPSDPAMNNLSTSFLGLTCFILFVLQLILHRMKEKLFIRGELAFINGDVISVVALIIWSGWSTNWTNDFTDGSFNWVNFFYICNAMNIFIGSVMMPTFITFTLTFNNSKNAGFARLFGASKNSDQQSMTWSSNRRVGDEPKSNENKGDIEAGERLLPEETWKTILKKELIDYFNGFIGRVDEDESSSDESNQSQTSANDSKETQVIVIANESKLETARGNKHKVRDKDMDKDPVKPPLDVIVRAYKGDINKRDRWWFKFKSLFVTPKNVFKDDKGRLIVLELINLQPETFLETEQSGQLAFDMATEMFVPEMITGLQSFRAYDLMWTRFDNDHLQKDVKIIITEVAKAKDDMDKAKMSRNERRFRGKYNRYWCGGDKRPANMEEAKAEEAKDDIVKIKAEMFQLTYNMLEATHNTIKAKCDMVIAEEKLDSMTFMDYRRKELLREFEKSQTNYADACRKEVRARAIKIKASHLVPGAIAELNVFGEIRNKCVKLIEDATQDLKRDLFVKFRRELYHMLIPVKNRMLSNNQAFVQPLARNIYEARKRNQQEERLRVELALVDRKESDTVKKTGGSRG